MSSLWAKASSCAVLINFAVLLTMMIGLCALALDASMLMWRRVQLQNAADAAALSAALEMSHAQTDYQSTAVAEAAQNGLTSGQNGVTVTTASPPTTGAFTSNTAAVQVKVSQTVSSIFHSGNSTLSALATATTAPCVYVMDTSPPSSIRYDIIANGSNYTMNCAVYGGYNMEETNTTGWASALYFTGGPGASSLSGGSLAPGHTTISFLWNAAPKTDPLSWVPNATNGYPVNANCDFTTNQTFTSSNPPRANKVYCGGLTVNGSGTVTFPPGVYIVAGGMDWQGPATIQGDGVAFVLTKMQGGTYTGFTMCTTTACPSVTLTASPTPLNGTLNGITYSVPAGMLIYGDRGWTHPGNTYDVNIGSAGTNLSLDGIIYLTNTGLQLSGGVITSPHYYGVVVKDWLMTNTNVTINGDYSGVEGGSPYQPGVALAE